MIVISTFVVNSKAGYDMEWDWVSNIICSETDMMSLTILYMATNMYYVTGVFEKSTGDVEELIIPGCKKLSNKGLWDVFIAQYDMYGNCLWARAAGSTAMDKANCIAYTQSGHIYIGESVGSQAQFEDISVTSGHRSFCIAKYDLLAVLRFISIICAYVLQ